MRFQLPLHQLIRNLYRFHGFGDLLQSTYRKIWLSRFRFRRFRRFLLSGSNLPDSSSHGLGEVSGVYINLDSRPDREAQVVEELRTVNLMSFQRFPAITRNPGILGCTLSHANVLQESMADSRPIMVCEDDVEFLANRDEIDAAVGVFLRDPSLDVLCLAYNLGAKPHRINSVLAITHDTQTASCYIVKHRAKGPLARVFLKGASGLERGEPAWAAANDIVWKRLQRSSLAFAIPNQPMARQRASFSDVEGRYVDYGV